eukprot:492688_1
MKFKLTDELDWEPNSGGQFYVPIIGKSSYACYGFLQIMFVKGKIAVFCDTDYTHGRNMITPVNYGDTYPTKWFHFYFRLTHFTKEMAFDTLQPELKLNGNFRHWSRRGMVQPLGFHNDANLTSLPIKIKMFRLKTNYGVEEDDDEDEINKYHFLILIYPILIGVG